MADSGYTKTRKTAVNALVHWAKTGFGQFTMREAVNDYLEASGANRPSIGGRLFEYYFIVVISITYRNFTFPSFTL